MKRLLITDLDNTLYDWVTYFARSFRAMVAALVATLDVPEEQLLDEFRRLNQSLGTVEHPYSVFQLPAVRQRFGAASPAELNAHLSDAFHAFNSERLDSLKLYDGVAETLAQLNAAGVTVVGHTESSMVNAYYRLVRLGVADRLTRLYVLETSPVDHPDPTRQAELNPPDGLIVEVPRRERKPNPALLLDICRREDAMPSDALYVGDSLTRDVAMAKHADVTAAWAKYGTRYEATDWQTIVRVSHWTDDDIAEDARLRLDAAQIQPDFVLEEFPEVRPIMATG